MVNVMADVGGFIVQMWGVMANVTARMRLKSCRKSRFEEFVPDAADVGRKCEGMRWRAKGCASRSDTRVHGDFKGVSVCCSKGMQHGDYTGHGDAFGTAWCPSFLRNGLCHISGGGRGEVRSCTKDLQRHILSFLLTDKPAE